MAAGIPMIIDCDPGIDDAVALLAAVHLADLVGVTTVNGNVGIDHTTRNALAVLEAANAPVPVHRGAGRPLRAAPRDARDVHGPTGLGDIELPEVGRDEASSDAVTFILDMARTIDGLQLVAIGPLTNVALALQRDPTLPSHLGGLTIMGGAAQGGNVTPVAEFNVWADPEAADLVFRLVDGVTMVGLDVTHQVLFGPDAQDRLRRGSTSAARLAADLVDFASRRAQTQGWDAAPIHDACAIVAATDPELFAGDVAEVAVELDGSLTRGMTVVDRRPGADPAGGGHLVLREVDAASVIDRVISAVHTPTVTTP